MKKNVTKKEGQGSRKKYAELFQKGCREILCGAFEENAASLRVMEKAGMQKLDKTEEIDYRGRLHRCVYYSMKTGTGTHR